MNPIKKMFGMDKEGDDCRDNEDGSTTCRRFKTDKDSKLATGSEVTIHTDQKTCKAFFTGYSVLDEDKEAFEELAKRKEKACRGGM
jgi:hypothetical protein